MAKSDFEKSLSFLGVLLFMVKKPVNHTQKGTPYGAQVHVEDRHSGGFTPISSAYYCPITGRSLPDVTRSLDLGSN